MQKQIIAAALIALIIGVLIGYFAAPAKVVEKEVVKEVQVEKKLKAAWIYVGPIGDYGWSHAHDQGRKYCEEIFPWLETVYAEAVSEADVDRYIDRFIKEEGCDVVFTTSFGYMDATIAAGERYPDKIFFHCSGYKRSPNVGTYFAEFYQLYYLNGLMAGALTQTGKAGYVAAHPIPEVIRHINAFAIGFAEVAMQRYERGEIPNPPEVHVVWIGAWYDPEKARTAAVSLISDGCDVLAFTEDSPTVVQVCEEYYGKYVKGEWPRPVYAFSHYSPMLSYGPNVTVSGQLVHWEVIYADIIAKIASGVYTTENLKAVDYWWMLHEGAVELGCNYSMPINPKFEAPLKSVTVVDKLTNETMTVYDLVFLRLEQMKDETPHVQVISGGEITWLTPNVTFDPFMGPLYDQDGNLRVPAGERLGHDELWTMMWFVKWVIGTIPT